jgi:hypothetical protein
MERKKIGRRTWMSLAVRMARRFFGIGDSTVPKGDRTGRPSPERSSPSDDGPKFSLYSFSPLAFRGAFEPSRATEFCFMVTWSPDRASEPMADYGKSNIA